MNVAICGNLQLGLSIKSELENSDINVTHFVGDDSQRGGGS